MALILNGEQGQLSSMLDEDLEDLMLDQFTRKTNGLPRQRGQDQDQKTKGVKRDDTSRPRAAWPSSCSVAQSFWSVKFTANRSGNQRQDRPVKGKYGRPGRMVPLNISKGLTLPHLSSPPKTMRRTTGDMLATLVVLSAFVLLLLPGCKCEDINSYTEKIITRDDMDPIRLWRPRRWERLPTESCPPCDLLFGKLRDGRHGEQGPKVQFVELQERGEPKSGTGFMFEWAMSSLAHSCRYLESAFGRGSCRIEWNFLNRTLIFEPHMAVGDEDKSCECKSVESVIISMTNKDKHALPVGEDCPWSHGRGIALPNERNLCGTVGHAPIKGETDLWRCMKDTNCDIVDDRLQMVVLRDPRAVAVSSYYHIDREHQKMDQTVDDFSLAFLPITCMWVTLRFLLFEGILSGQSTVYWYEDAYEDPLGWHRQFLYSVGLNLPDAVVSEATRRSVQGGNIMNFPAKGIDKHDGGEQATMGRSFRDEVMPKTLLKMDHILRLWLPPVLLMKLGIPS